MYQIKKCEHHDMMNVVIPLITLQFTVKLIYIFRLHLTYLQKLQFTRMEEQTNHGKYSSNFFSCHIKRRGNYFVLHRTVHVLTGFED